MGRLIAIINAIDNCEGLMIPYSIAKKMKKLNEELKEYLNSWKKTVKNK